jgi:hypothetical protein
MLIPLGRQVLSTHRCPQALPNFLNAISSDGHAQNARKHIDSAFPAHIAGGSNATTSDCRPPLRPSSVSALMSICRVCGNPPTVNSLHRSWVDI